MKKYLIISVSIVILSCQNFPNSSKITLEEEIQILQDSLDSKTAKLKERQRYIITQSQVGSISKGDKIEGIHITYPLELIKSEQIRSTEEGNTIEPIYILSESGVELFKIKQNYNYSRSTYDDLVGEINIINPRFKTSKSIGVGNTIEDFFKVYRDGVLNYSYVSDRFWIETEELNKTQFEVDFNSFTSDIDLFSSDLVELKPEHFDKSGKITRIRIF